MLAALPDRSGLESLCRLTRFESSLRLSAAAAMAAMEQSADPDPKIRNQHARQVRHVLAGNDRMATQWLLAYADDLEGQTFSIDRWQNLIAIMCAEVDAAATQQASRLSVLRLVRIVAAMAAQSGHRDEAIALATDHLDLVPPQTAALIDASTWAVDNNLHPVITTLFEQQPRLFNADPMLLYAAAEAKNEAGDATTGADLAAKALQMPPLPAISGQKDLSPNQIEVAMQRHRSNAGRLESRGLFQWAIKEYELVIDAAELDDGTAMAARAALSEMLFELERFDQVIPVLEPLVDRLIRDSNAKTRYVRFGDNLATLQSRLLSSQAEIALARNDSMRGQELLVQAFGHEPSNVDILIRMYRVDGGDQWNANVRKQLQKKIRSCQTDVDEAILEVQQRDLFGKARLSAAYNAYAWLVANTEGDFKLALDYSLRSLALETDPALLDTCARCYFALRQYDMAIATQQRAVNRMPHSPPILRQLEFFKAARAEALEKESSKAESSPAAFDGS